MYSKCGRNNFEMYLVTGFDIDVKLRHIKRQVKGFRNLSGKTLFHF